MIRGALNALGISLLLYAAVAVWFDVTVFAVMVVLSMLCLIRAEQLRRRERFSRYREQVWQRRIEGQELARCMDCGGWWTLDALAMSGGACGHCTPVRAPGIGGDR